MFSVRVGWNVLIVVFYAPFCNKIFRSYSKKLFFYRYVKLVENNKLIEEIKMQLFEAGDDLVFQLESGYGLLRVLAIDNLEDGSHIWHLMAYEELFPDVEFAEQALANPSSLTTRVAHMPLTDRAFERTPTAKLGNRPVKEEELTAYHEWLDKEDREISDRSALLMLGLR